MKILLDNCSGHITIERMLPIWKKMAYRVTEDVGDKCEIMLSYVRIGTNFNIPKILRLDGIYYDSDTDFNTRNSNISKSHMVADGIIYQSRHSMGMCEKYLGKKRNDVRPVIIHNGIKKDWCGSPIEHKGINISVANKWRRHKRLKEIIGLFLEFQKDFTNSTLHIFGKLHDNRIVNHPNIKYYGHVERPKLIDMYRKTDFTIHLSKRDSCPNSVVEYIGAGIPVITTDNCGGATEMCYLSSGCHIISGDGDYYNLDPVPHYREEWNVLPKKVHDELLDTMKKVAVEKNRAELHEVLTIEHMSKCYIQYMLETIVQGK
jgi:glycosyltransferase involved in cell wall biosynthesis